MPVMVEGEVRHAPLPARVFARVDHVTRVGDALPVGRPRIALGRVIARFLIRIRLLPRRRRGRLETAQRGHFRLDGLRAAGHRSHQAAGEHFAERAEHCATFTVYFW